MKWGYRYENEDLALNERAEGEGLTAQGLYIWCKQEKAEYRSAFGFDRNFLTASGGYAAPEVVSKLKKDLYFPPDVEAEFELEAKAAEALSVRITFK